MQAGGEGDEDAEHDRGWWHWCCSLRCDHAVRMLAVDLQPGLCVRSKTDMQDPRSQEEYICGMLNMTLYGTLDAGQYFELTITTVVTGAGCFTRCLQPVRVRRESAWHIPAQSRWRLRDWRDTWRIRLVEVLRKVFIVQDRGVLGPDNFFGRSN